MKFAVIVFPGSNCDLDMYHAIKDELGEEAEYVWHDTHDLSGYDGILLPGGFSYGDYLRAGAIARFSGVMDEVRKAAEAGKPVLWRPDRQGAELGRIAHSAGGDGLRRRVLR